MSKLDVIDTVEVSFDTHKKLEYIDTLKGERIFIDPPIELNPGEDYLVRFLSNNTIEIFILIAEGTGGSLQ